MGLSREELELFKVNLPFARKPIHTFIVTWWYYFNKKKWNMFFDKLKSGMSFPFAYDDTKNNKN